MQLALAALRPEYIAVFCLNLGYQWSGGPSGLYTPPAMLLCDLLCLPINVVKVIVGIAILYTATLVGYKFLQLSFDQPETSLSDDLGISADDVLIAALIDLIILSLIFVFYFLLIVGRHWYNLRLINRGARRNAEMTVELLRETGTL